tara:strand:+ start:19134 stop:20150 length:1017 start_codon:yes stop_codon:yes gene_type:complete
VSNHVELIKIAQKIAEPGKGILAADESHKTIAKRFATINVESTEENRRDYREMLFTAPDLGNYVSGVILFEETLGQKAKDGTPLSKVLLDQDILPGIKVDKGLVDLPFTEHEKVTQGLDGLAERLAQYYEMGARFAKWRAVFNITNDKPSELAIHANAHALARYAAFCQHAGLVPIVEPEVLMDGDHSLERCSEVTEHVLHQVFHELESQHVILEGMILKPSMVIPGTEHAPASVEDVARETVKVLQRTVPSAVPSINFLSGGQSAELATQHLNAMHTLHSDLPWYLSFSYGRALQQPSLDLWHGKADNVDNARAALTKRARLNSEACLGKYTEAMES